MYAGKSFTDRSHTPEELRALLPKVGAVLLRKPEFGQSCDVTQAAKPRPCVVTYVHTANLWYEVEFKNRDGSTFRQCYKLPEDANYDQKYSPASLYLETARHAKK